MEGIIRTKKGRHTKNSEPRTEGINIRATKTQVAELNAIIAIKKERGVMTSQADVLLGGMQAGEAVSKVWNARNDLANRQHSLQVAASRAKREQRTEDVYLILAQVDILETVVAVLDRALSTEK